MPAEAGTPIVARALELAELHPRMAAVHVLDAAMQGHSGQTIDFRCDTAPGASYTDWLDPPSAFAELLRRAFGAHLKPEQLDWQSPAWEFDVIEAFTERYDVIPAGMADLGYATFTHDGAPRGRVAATGKSRVPPTSSPSGASWR